MKKETSDKRLITEELAKLFRVEPQTIRRGYCICGHYMGLKPLKLPNRRLLWSRSDALRILGQGREALD
jgi:hypothetical protein